ncbi:hypothetical protein ACOY57_24245, partial [Enterobacter hormaechei]|uniref:hypothetical protein n=1 Tax=Enterobacter hormaechei TaxID=158836 RepID=UPI003BC89F11
SLWRWPKPRTLLVPTKPGAPDMQARALRACALVAAVFLALIAAPKFGEMRGRASASLPLMPWSTK